MTALRAKYIRDLAVRGRALRTQLSYTGYVADLVRIRHYGILANNRRQRDIPRARALLERPGKSAPKPAQSAPLEPMLCPQCGRSGLRWIGFIDARGQTHLKARAQTPDSS